MAASVEIEGVWKRYRRGRLGARTLRDELQALGRRLRGERPGADALRDQEFWALRDVNLVLEPGSVTGIVGKNGAGKSTLLKLLGRISEPTRGEIRVRGRLASLLEVGTGFHPELSGRDNVFLNGAILGMSRQEVRRKFDAIVAFAEIGEFLDTPVKRYSSGMYVRLAFAVAAHLDPDIFVVDEVLAVGDHDFQRRCLGRMEDMAREEGRTILFVSHQLAAVRRLCHRAVVMRRGELSGLMPVEDAISAHLGTFRMTGTEIALGEAERKPGHGRAARILAARVGGDGRLVSGAPLRLEVDVDVREAERRFAVAVEFVAMDGQPLLLIESDATPSGELRAPGLHRVTFACPRFPLQAGPHRARVAVLDGAAVVDEVRRAAQWEVHPGVDAHDGRSRGGCRGEAEVEVTRVAG